MPQDWQVLDKPAPTVAENLPAVHPIHAALVDTPVLDWYVPASHVKQSESLVDPVIDWYLPVLQEAHTLKPCASPTVPSGHGEHCVRPEVAAYLP